jgi:hypothetical protein
MCIGGTNIDCDRICRVPPVLRDEIHCTELKFDKLVELLESSYIETERREQLEEHGGEEKQHDSALVMSKSKSGGQRREATPEDECRHCHLHGHFQRNCHYYLEKVKHGWRHPLPCRSKKDRTDDDRDPTRRNKNKKDGDNNNNSKKKQKKNDDDDQAKAFLTFHSDTDSALMAMDVLCYREKTEKDEWVVDFRGNTPHDVLQGRSRQLPIYFDCGSSRWRL